MPDHNANTGFSGRLKTSVSPSLDDMTSTVQFATTVVLSIMFLLEKVPESSPF
jgi:hypothetical protein